MPEHTFDSIIDALAARRQRATYTAVAGLVGATARSLMVGRPRDPRHSWVVSMGTGQPTGYKAEQIDPELATRPEVLRTTDALRSWLMQQ